MDETPRESAEKPLVLAPWGSRFVDLNVQRRRRRAGSSFFGHLFRIENGIGMGRCLCGNAYIGAAKLRPGVIECNGAGHIPIGEPSGVMSPRLLALESLLNNAGLGARAHPDIRREHPVLLSFQSFIVLQTHAYCNFHSWSCR